MKKSTKIAGVISIIFGVLCGLSVFSTSQIAISLVISIVLIVGGIALQKSSKVAWGALTIISAVLFIAFIIVAVAGEVGDSPALLAGLIIFALGFLFIFVLLIKDPPTKWELLEDKSKSNKTDSP